MEKKLVSLVELLAKAKEHNMRASATPFQQFDVKTSELKPHLKGRTLQKTANGSEVYVFGLDGYTIKYSRDMDIAVTDSESVEISFYEANVDSKSKPGTQERITWIRITAVA
jgi:hypothetical protein